MNRAKKGWLDGVSWAGKRKQKALKSHGVHYLLFEHTIKNLGFEHPVLRKTGESGYLPQHPSLSPTSFRELCFLFRFWLKTRQAMAAECISGTDAACQGLAWSRSSFFAAVVSTRGLILQQSAWSRGAIRPKAPKRLVQNPHCLGFVLEAGKSILGLFRHA